MQRWVSWWFHPSTDDNGPIVASLSLMTWTEQAPPLQKSPLWCYLQRLRPDVAGKVKQLYVGGEAQLKKAAKEGKQSAHFHRAACSVQRSSKRKCRPTREEGKRQRMMRWVQGRPFMGAWRRPTKNAIAVWKRDIWRETALIRNPEARDWRWTGSRGLWMELYPLVCPCRH